MLNRFSETKVGSIIIIKIVAMVLAVEGLAMIPSICAGLYYSEHSAIKGLVITFIITISFAAFVLKKYKSYNVKLNIRDGFFVAFLSWWLVCLFGSLPYFLAGLDFSFIDSLFESTAGWTTTGAFVIPIRRMPNTLLLWKATSNWFGGMGILVFTISLLPTLGKGAQNLAASETTGPKLTKFASKLSDSTKISYIIYCGLTLLEFVLLLFDKSMSSFHAVINTLSTVSTAGIFDVGGEIAWSFTPYAKFVISIFSVIGAMNFVIFFLIVTGNIKRAFSNIEARSYLIILSIASALIFANLIINDQYPVLKSLGYAITQSISFGSTSGFSVTDVSHWPAFSQAVLVLLMLIGGCATSTAGSLKVIRVLVFIKLIRRGFYKRIHPLAVKPIMLGKTAVSADIANRITVYITLYLGILLLGALLISFDNKDMFTTLTASLGALSNNGSGLGDVSSGDFSIFSPLSKFVSLSLMLIGRTEIYATLIVFTKDFWSRD